MKIASMLPTALLIGCVSSETPDFEREAELEQSAQSLRALELDSGLSVCTDARLIATVVDAQSDCALDGAVPEGWTAQRLFADGSPLLTSSNKPVPGELRRYCAYTRDTPPVADSGYPEMVAALEESEVIDMSSVAMDCLGRLPQAELPDLGDVHDALHEAFRLNIDWVSGAELDVSADARVAIDVAVVDTISHIAANNLDVEAVNDHGQTMAAVINDIRCPGANPNCADSLYHNLALPRDSWDAPANWYSGGQYGTQGDVAVAIYEAVIRWEQRRASAPETTGERLVLNLSLGWEAPAGQAVDLTRGPAAAVESALEYAACQGALVFVAAGNNPDPGCDDEHAGLTVPAVFESHDAPNAERCAELGFEAAHTLERPVFGSMAADHPLVFAVGGVDAFDEPLINSRVGGQPSLVALGSDATSVADGDGALTGTSISTAVASGAAALIWSYRPQLRPRDVVALLHDSGWATGQLSDAVNGPEEVHRISVCAALDAACRSAPAHLCPALDCEASAPASDGNLGGFFAELGDAVDATTIDAFVTEVEVEAPSCTGEPFATLAAPQPELPVCPYCNIDVPPDDDDDDETEQGAGVGDDTVFMMIDPAYRGMILDVSLRTFDAERNARLHAFDTEVVDSLNSSTSGATTVVVDAGAAVSAALIFTLDTAAGVMTQINPIAVDSAPD